MRISSRLSLTIILVALFFGGLVVNEAEAQNILSAIFNRMQAQQKYLYSFRSKITMEKYDSLLKFSDVTIGTIIYRRGKGKQILSRIDWTKPAQESLLLTNDKFVLYRPRLKQAFMGTTDRIKKNYGYNALSFLNMSQDELRANYNIRYLGEETVRGGSRTWHLTVTPKKRTVYQLAELWVDGNGMPIQAKVIERNNDSTTILLSDLKKNETIKVADIQINLPEATKIIKVSDGDLPTDTIKPNEAKTVKRIRKSKRVKKITVRKKRRSSKRVKNAGC